METYVCLTRLASVRTKLDPSRTSDLLSDKNYLQAFPNIPVPSVPPFLCSLVPLFPCSSVPLFLHFFVSSFLRSPSFISLFICFFLTLQIFCDEGIADVVVRVDEPSSCSYVITVHTNKLCKHSLFRSSPAQKPKSITCSPALPEERYKIYVERVGE